MKNLYCISGLGADERIFAHLNVPGNHLVHLPWVEHEPKDDIARYAQKMAALIKEQNPTILGLSFGGMVAVEIAKLMPVKQTILVSSAKSKNELPDFDGTLKFFIQHNLIPYGLFKKPNTILYDKFGAESEEDKNILKLIMKDTDTHFLGWAFKAILNWKNIIVPPKIIHIHGTADKVIPPNSVTANYWIENGSHMMMYNRANTINEILTQHI